MWQEACEVQAGQGLAIRGRKQQVLYVGVHRPVQWLLNICGEMAIGPVPHPLRTPKTMVTQALYLFDSQAWWHVPRVSTIWRLGQEDCLSTWVQCWPGQHRRTYVSEKRIERNLEWRTVHTHLILGILPRFLAMTNAMYIPCKQLFCLVGLIWLDFETISYYVALLTWDSKASSCFCLSDGIKGMCHHARYKWLLYYTV